MLCLVTANNKKLIKHQFLRYSATFVSSLNQRVSYKHPVYWDSSRLETKEILQWFIDACTAYNVSIKNINIFVISNVDEVWWTRTASLSHSNSRTNTCLTTNEASNNCFLFYQHHEESAKFCINKEEISLPHFRDVLFPFIFMRVDLLRAR